MSTIKKPTPPKADDSWLSPKKDISHLVADTTTQEPQKGIMEEVELDFPHQDDNCWLMIDVSGIKVRQYPSPLEVKMLIHHQLQKARQDWLREEIVKLEGMKKDIPTRQVHWLQTINKTNRRYARKKAEAHNQALQAIIDRYSQELNETKV